MGEEWMGGSRPLKRHGSAYYRRLQFDLPAMSSDTEHVILSAKSTVKEGCWMLLLLETIEALLLRHIIVPSRALYERRAP